MILFVEDKYGTIQVNDAYTPIDVKELHKAIEIAYSKNYACYLSVWNEDMTKRFTSVKPTRCGLRKLLEFLTANDL